jgi:hypothetical protein
VLYVGVGNDVNGVSTPPTVIEVPVCIVILIHHVATGIMFCVGVAGTPVMANTLVGDASILLFTASVILYPRASTT